MRTIQVERYHGQPVYISTVSVNVTTWTPLVYIATAVPAGAKVLQVRLVGGLNVAATSTVVGALHNLYLTPPGQSEVGFSFTGFPDQVVVVEELSVDVLANWAGNGSYAVRGTARVGTGSAMVTMSLMPFIEVTYEEP